MSHRSSVASSQRRARSAFWLDTGYSTALRLGSGRHAPPLRCGQILVLGTCYVPESVGLHASGE